MTCRIPRRGWFLIVLVALLLGCSRPNLVPVGAIAIVEFAKEEMADTFINGGITYFDEHADHVGTEQNERLPEWAKDAYSTCVYWKDGFTSTHISLPGQNVRGDAWGWILVNEDLETFVVELSYQRDDSDEIVTLIDRWDGPAEDSSAAGP